MNEAKRYCANCKREVIGLFERGSLYCPDCWNKLEQPETGAKSENRKENLSLRDDFFAVLRVLSIFALVLVGIFLVFLAFVFAACSGMNL